MSNIKRYYFGPEGMIGQDFQIDQGLYAYVRYQDHLKVIDKHNELLLMYDKHIKRMQDEIKELKEQRDAAMWYPMQEISNE